MLSGCTSLELLEKTHSITVMSIRLNFIPTLIKYIGKFTSQFGPTALKARGAICAHKDINFPEWSPAIQVMFNIHI